MPEYLGNADEITIETDERGFELHFSTDQGRYRVNIHGAASDLYEAVQRTIAPWWAEGLAVKDEMRFKDLPDPDSARRFAFMCNPDESAGFACGVQARADFDAYETSDPKSPSYHSIHADIHDARAGK